MPNVDIVVVCVCHAVLLAVYSVYSIVFILRELLCKFWTSKIQCMFVSPPALSNALMYREKRSRASFADLNSFYSALPIWVAGAMRIFHSFGIEICREHWLWWWYTHSVTFISNANDQTYRILLICDRRRFGGLYVLRINPIDDFNIYSNNYAIANSFGHLFSCLHRRPLCTHMWVYWIKTYASFAVKFWRHLAVKILLGSCEFYSDRMFIDLLGVVGAYDQRHSSHDNRISTSATICAKCNQQQAICCVCLLADCPYKSASAMCARVRAWPIRNDCIETKTSWTS